MCVGNSNKSYCRFCHRSVNEVICHGIPDARYILYSISLHFTIRPLFEQIILFPILLHSLKNLGWDQFPNYLETFMHAAPLRMHGTIGYKTIRGGEKSRKRKTKLSGIRVQMVSDHLIRKEIIETAYYSELLVGVRGVLMKACELEKWQRFGLGLHCYTMTFCTTQFI